MNATIFIVILVGVIFGVDAARRWWRQNQWRYHSRDDDPEI